MAKKRGFFVSNQRNQILPTPLSKGGEFDVAQKLQVLGIGGGLPIGERNFLQMNQVWNGDSKGMGSNFDTIGPLRDFSGEHRKIEEKVDF